MRSLLEIYISVWECYDYSKDEDNNSAIERLNKGKQAADEFAVNLIALGERWASALENNIKELAAPTAPPSIIFNKINQKTFYKGIRYFLNDVCNSLIIHGFSYREIRKHLTPFACYLLGLESSKMVIKNGIQKDEALRVFEEMKGQGFSDMKIFKEEIFPDVFSVFGCKVKNNPEPQQSNAAQTIDKKEMDLIKPFIDKAIEAGLCSFSDNRYKWKKEKGSKQLLAYFAERLIEKFKLYDKEYKSIRRNEETLKFEEVEIKGKKWSIFEDLFNQKRDSLKNRRNAWYNNHNTDEFKPNNHEIIDRIIN